MEQYRAKQGVAATSRRHQVTTSGQQCRSQRFSNVATSPRRDVRSKICTSSFNVRTARKLEHGEAYEERHGIPEQIDTDFEEVPGICIVFLLLDIILDFRMMFLILDIWIFSFMMF